MKRNILIFFIAIMSSFAWAGSQANDSNTLDPEKIIKFSKDVEKFAAAQGARAFIISRVGRPLKELPRGIHFTHTAVAIYSDIQLTEGERVKGYAIHNLYQKQDAPNQSKLITDYPIDFFWGAKVLKAGIIIPSEEIQHRLIEIIASGENIRLHNPKYSVISNPMNQQFQNCTEYTLDMLNAAIYQTNNIAKLKANTKAYYTPHRLKTSPIKLAFGSLMMKDLTTKDHQGKVATATFGSIHKYLDKYDLVKLGVTLNDNGNYQIL